MGSRTSGINVGDRVFRCANGEIVGSWQAGFSSGIVMSEHWDGSGRLTPHAEVDWDTIVDADDRLPIEVLLAEVPDGKWNTIRGGGVHLDPESASKLEEMWENHVHSMGGSRAAWTLTPGQSINRKALHEIYGGRSAGWGQPLSAISQRDALYRPEGRTPPRLQRRLGRG